MTARELESIIRGMTPALRDVLTTELRAITGRVARLEQQWPRDGRDGQPGRDGLPGPRGDAGLDGKDGHDGLGMDDFESEYDGARTLILRFKAADRVKELRVVLAGLPLYCGRWSADRAYDRGDIVTIGGSHWHCNDATTDRPGETAAWTLSVKGIGRR